MNYVLFNPLSNNGRGEDCVAKAVRAVGGKAVCVDVTRSDVHALVAGLTEKDSLVLCGGDGTLNRFVNDVADLPMPYTFYLMRSGTGNDFIKDLDTPAEQRLIPINDYVADLPTVEIEGKIYRFLNNVAFGVDGEVCQMADKMKSQGKQKINYTAIALRLLLFSYLPPNATVTIDGVTRHYKHVWMTPVMNGRYFGGGMQVAPMQNRMADHLSVICVHHSPRLKVLLRFPTIFAGKHIRYREMIDWHYGHEIKVVFDRPMAAQIDGETIPGVTTFVARKHPELVQNEVKEMAEATTK